MDKDKLQKRLEDINKAIEQVIANYNLLLGCKQECENWIKEVNKELENVSGTEAGTL